MDIWQIFLILLVFPFIYFLYGIIKIILQQGFFVPLPYNTIKEILNMIRIKKLDVLYDLGSGDGRIPILASKIYGIRSVGIENSRFLIWLSKRKVKKNQLQNKVKIIHGNIFDQDIKDASIVVFYLTQRLTDKLKPKLKKELKKGVRVISVSYRFKDWRIEKSKKIGHFYVYLYKI